MTASEFEKLAQEFGAEIARLSHANKALTADRDGVIEHLNTQAEFLRIAIAERDDLKTKLAQAHEALEIAVRTVELLTEAEIKNMRLQRPEPSP